MKIDSAAPKRALQGVSQAPLMVGFAAFNHPTSDPFNRLLTLEHDLIRAIIDLLHFMSGIKQNKTIATKTLSGCRKSCVAVSFICLGEGANLFDFLRYPQRPSKVPQKRCTNATRHLNSANYLEYKETTVNYGASDRFNAR